MFGSGYFITKTRLYKYIENFTTKNSKFSNKKSDIFHISAQNIDCGYSLEQPRRGGSDEYQQAMFLSRDKKNNVYPCKPQFYYIKVEFKGVKIIEVCFRDVVMCHSDLKFYLNVRIHGSVLCIWYKCSSLLMDISWYNILSHIATKASSNFPLN